MNKKSEEEKLALRNKAKKELLELESRVNESDVFEDINNFKNKFLICEKIYKCLLEPYLKEKNELPDKNRNLTIRMNQVKPVLFGVGYDFDEEILVKIFGSEYHRGKMSVKKIRNSLTHDMKKNDIEEFKKRKDELNSYMDYFLEKIRNFDEVA